MAYYAELKRRCWHKINGGNAIWWYKKKLYDDWYNSLTVDEKIHLEESKRREAARRRKEADKAIGRLLSITAMMADLSKRTGNKYGNIYDE